MASLWDSFMGNSQAEDIARGRLEADAAYRRALEDSTATRSQYLDRSLGEFSGLQPAIDSGVQTGVDTNAMLRAALGVDGPEAQGRFFSNIQLDPGYTSLFDSGVKALDASAASRGLLRSGGQMRDLFSFGQNALNSFYNNRIGQLSSLLGSSQNTLGLGANVAGTKAGLIGNTGGAIADAQFGTGQLFGNNAISSANALAASRSIPINNLLAVGNLVAKFMPWNALGGSGGVLPGGKPLGQGGIGSA